MDYTGKAGGGKRYLDEHGNFRPVTSLPKETQEEIRKNSRNIQAAQTEKMKRRNALREGVAPVTDSESVSELKEIVKQQSQLIQLMIAGQNADKKPAVAEAQEKEVEPEKPLTRKQLLQAECNDLGIAFTEKDKIKDLERMLAAENGENDGTVPKEEEEVEVEDESEDDDL